MTVIQWEYISRTRTLKALIFSVYYALMRQLLVTRHIKWCRNVSVMFRKRRFLSHINRSYQHIQAYARTSAGGFANGRG